MEHKVDLAELESLWECKFSKKIGKLLPTDLEYEYISGDEVDDRVSDIIKEFNSLKESGEHRAEEWEKGWKENYQKYSWNKDPQDLIPKYYGKHPILRFRRGLIMPKSETHEYDIIKFIVTWLADEYLSNHSNIFEFGCGSAHNLPTIQSVVPDAKITGLDWSAYSQSIIGLINDSELSFGSGKFDFFKPDYSLDVPKDSAFITVAALEQVGENFHPFIGFCMTKKPSICVHIEPINELMDTDNVFDRLSVVYSKKRNYLNGFLTFLREMAGRGSIEILRQQRTYTGSYLIEGHSVVIWRPL